MVEAAKKIRMGSSMTGPKYTKRQVLDKIQEAERFLFDSQRKSRNEILELGDLYALINVLGAAHNMAIGIYNDKEQELKPKLQGN